MPPTYIVRQTVTEGHDKHVNERLVESANKSAAIRHVASDTIAADVAAIADVVRLTKAGVNVEQANAD